MARATIRMGPKDLATALGKKQTVKTKAGKVKVLAPRPSPSPPGTHSGKSQPRQTFDSEDEVIYADHLDARLSRKEIRRWDYQPERFRLGDATTDCRAAWYTPDFRIVDLDDRVVFVEIKGFQREAALVRLKVAASLHPYRFVMLRRRPPKEGGGWELAWDSHGQGGVL